MHSPQKPATIDASESGLAANSPGQSRVEPPHRPSASQTTCDTRDEAARVSLAKPRLTLGRSLGHWIWTLHRVDRCRRSMVERGNHHVHSVPSTSRLFHTDLSWDIKPNTRGPGNKEFPRAKASTDVVFFKYDPTPRPIFMVICIA